MCWAYWSERCDNIVSLAPIYFKVHSARSGVGTVNLTREDNKNHLG
jgi:hypothetical protein